MSLIPKLGKRQFHDLLSHKYPHRMNMRRNTLPVASPIAPRLTLSTHGTAFLPSRPLRRHRKFPFRIMHVARLQPLIHHLQTLPFIVFCHFHLVEHNIPHLIAGRSLFAKLSTCTFHSQWCPEGVSRIQERYKTTKRGNVGKPNPDRPPNLLTANRTHCLALITKTVWRTKKGETPRPTKEKKTPLPMHIFGACRKKLNFLPLFLWWLLPTNKLKR